MSFRRSLAAFAALGMLLLSCTIAKAGHDASSAAASIAEVRRAFTLNGQIIPPEIFRDFGDGDLADSSAIWVTIDLAAAVGSNLYADPIREYGAWKIQKKQRAEADTPEETAYAYKGAAANGLIVVVASYNGGGSGTFHTLHILDVAAATGIDLDGKRYQRINLTDIRSVALGDRWEGEVTLAGNTIRITTTRGGPGSAGTRPPLTITAERP